MSKQNRVTPFGKIEANSARGTKMGNRGGCLHNGQQKIITSYTNKHWIICKTEYKDRHRAVMSPGLYTELFFLDEAAALAAGHRPCYHCSYQDFKEFQRLWATANPVEALHNPEPQVDVIDEVLHRERLTHARRKMNMKKLTYRAQLADLPDGSFIMWGEDNCPYLVLDAWLLKWTFTGYAEPHARPTEAEVEVLTPQSIVKTLKQGYKPAIQHPFLKGKSKDDRYSS